MENQELVARACKNHMQFARGFYRLIENFLIHSQNRILLWLEQQENPCAVDISNHFGLTAGRVSNILKSLEEKGYITREKRADDRRNSYIILTPAGKAEAERTFQGVQYLYETFFEKLGPEDAEAFLDMEEKLVALFTDTENS